MGAASVAATGAAFGGTATDAGAGETGRVVGERQHPTGVDEVWVLQLAAVRLDRCARQ